MAQFGDFRRSIIIETSIVGGIVDFYGNTTNITTNQYFDLKNAFTGASLNIYTQINDLELSQLSENDYVTRRDDFLSTLPTLTASQKSVLQLTSEGNDLVACPPPPFTPTTTTTTTTIVPTTTTTTTTTTTLSPAYFWVGSNAGGIIRSDNGGVTWATKTAVPSQLYPEKLSFRGLTGFGLHSDAQSIDVTTDGGVTWTNKVAGVNNMISLYAVNTNLLISGPTVSNNIYVSINGGTSWTTKTFSGFPMALQKIYFASNQIGYGLYRVPSSNGSCLVKTTDGGNTWSNITGSLTAGFTTPNPGYNDIAIATNGIGYILKSRATGGDQVLKTTDGGVTWTLIGTLPTPTNLSLSNIALLSNGNVIISGEDKTLTRPIILKSTDGGATWGILTLLGTIEKGSIIFDSLGFINDNVGGAFIYKTAPSVTKQYLYTTDGGNTWNISTDPLLSSIDGSIGYTFGFGQASL